MKNLIIIMLLTLPFLSFSQVVMSKRLSHCIFTYHDVNSCKYGHIKFLNVEIFTINEFSEINFQKPHYLRLTFDDGCLIVLRMLDDNIATYSYNGNFTLDENDISLLKTKNLVEWELVLRNEIIKGSINEKRGLKFLNYINSETNEIK